MGVGSGRGLKPLVVWRCPMAAGFCCPKISLNITPVRQITTLFPASARVLPVAPTRNQLLADDVNRTPEPANSLVSASLFGVRCVKGWQILIQSPQRRCLGWMQKASSCMGTWLALAHSLLFHPAVWCLLLTLPSPCRAAVFKNAFVLSNTETAVLMKTFLEQKQQLTGGAYQQPPVVKKTKVSPWV